MPPLKDLEKIGNKELQVQTKDVIIEPLETIEKIIEEDVEDLVSNDLEDIVDEEIEKVKEKEAIEEIQRENEEDKIIDNNINDSIKASLEIVLLGKEILKNDIDYVTKFTKVSEQNIKVMNSHYELNSKVDKQTLYYKGYWIAIGVIGTLIFPEVVPYLEEGYKWLKELRGK